MTRHDLRNQKTEFLVELLNSVNPDCDYDELVRVLRERGYKIDASQNEEAVRHSDDDSEKGEDLESYISRVSAPKPTDNDFNRQLKPFLKKGFRGQNMREPRSAIIRVLCKMEENPNWKDIDPREKSFYETFRTYAKTFVFEKRFT